MTSTLLRSPGVKKQKQMYINVSFYYDNINGLGKKEIINMTINLNMIISEHNPHIVCLVETNLSDNITVNIPGYYIF